MKLTASFSFLTSVILFGAVCVQAQPATRPVALSVSRGFSGKLQVPAARPAKGAYLGAYLGTAKGGNGALVGKVMEGSPAALAGIEEADVLLEIGEQPIKNAAQLYEWLSQVQPATSVKVRLRRSEAERTVTVQLGERIARGEDACQKLFGEANALQAEGERLKALSNEAARKGDQKAATEQAEAAETFFKQAQINRLDVETAIAEGRAGSAERAQGCLPAMKQPESVSFGLEGSALTPQLAKHFGVAGSGLLIAEIKADSLAAKAGLKVGDCLTQINERSVQSSLDLKPIAESLPQDAELVFTIYRDGKPMTLRIKR